MFAMPILPLRAACWCADALGSGAGRANRPDYPLTLNHESTPTLLPAALTSLLSGVQLVEPLHNVGAGTPRALYAVQHGSSDGSDPPEAVEGPPSGDPGSRRPGHHGPWVG